MNKLKGKHVRNTPSQSREVRVMKEFFQFRNIFLIPKENEMLVIPSKVLPSVVDAEAVIR